MTDNNKPNVNSEEYLAAQQEIIKAIAFKPSRSTGEEMSEGYKPKIYVFIDCGGGTKWIEGIAVAEDGCVVARHISSSEDFFKWDMGLKSERKHDLYKEKYPAGFELVHIEDPATSNDEGFVAMVKIAEGKQTR